MKNRFRSQGPEEFFETCVFKSLRDTCHPNTSVGGSTRLLDDTQASKNCRFLAHFGLLTQPMTTLERHHFESIQPKDANEASYIQRMLTLMGTQAPTHRAQFEPGHFTASGFILSPDNQQILLIFHSKLKLWLQPGGHIDATDKSLLAAAKREVLEEVGLEATLHPSFPGILDVDIHTIPARKTEPAHEHFDVRYALQAPSLEFQAGSDALSARWVPLDQVEEAHSDASVTRAVFFIRDRLKSNHSN